MEKFFTAMREPMMTYGIYTGYKNGPLSDATEEKRYEAWMKAAEYFEKEVPAARRLLEDELRSIITPPKHSPPT